MIYQKKIIILGLIFFIATSCQRLSLRGEETFYGNKAYYSFDPKTILSDIARGNTNVFTLQTATPEPPLSNSFNTVRWTEEDYFNIIQALYKFVGNETIEGWNIRYVLLSTKCEDISEGPQVAHFILYKVVETPEKESRFERRINIDPSNHSASWFEYEFSPNLVGQYPVELSRYKYSTTEVLQLAEKNGGETIRMDVSNNCTVDVEFIRGSDIWRVSYVQVLKLFVVDVNALTGESKIITQEMEESLP